MSRRRQSDHIGSIPSEVDRTVFIVNIGRVVYCFVDHCLCFFSTFDCWIVCSLVYGFWLAICSRYDTAEILLKLALNSQSINLLITPWYLQTFLKWSQYSSWTCQTWLWLNTEMLPVSLDYSFVIAPKVFSYVYWSTPLHMWSHVLIYSRLIIWLFIAKCPVSSISAIFKFNNLYRKKNQNEGGMDVHWWPF